MGRAGKIARRTFLIGSAAIAGGVAFGTYTYRRPGTNPLLATLEEGEAAITPYVKIDAEKVTLITPRADVGQGAYSIQAHLIAEELDVDLDEVRVDPGTPSPVYYNAKVAAEGFPVSATDDGTVANLMRGAGDVMGKFIGLQITGGSTTVPDGFDKLRHAGAVARETLKLAASNQTGIAVDRLRTEKGAVILPDGTSLAYTELAAAAADMEPVEDVQLRGPDQWRYVTKDHKRIDIMAKSTGTQDYGIDLVMDGMVHATIRTNPRLGGAMNSYDASVAEKMRGVSKVVPISGGVGVIADNTWRAFKAADAVTFDWGPAPYPASTAEHFEAVANSFGEDFRDSGFKEEGDVEATLSQGDVLEAEYRVPYLAHAPLEPMSAVVKVTDDRVDIWTGTQIPRFMQQGASEVTGIDVDDIHIHALMSGGSFGRRLEDDYVRQALEVAMSVKGTPVKMVWTREEDFSHDFPRTLGISRARGSVKDGQIHAYDLKLASPSTSSSQMGCLGQSVPGPDVSLVAGAWDQPFAIPNYRVTGYRTPELAPISSWRSVGASGNGFLHACFLDELADAADVDPMDELLRLCNHDVSRTVLEEVKSMSGWDGRVIAEGKRARGVAFTLAFGVPVAQVVEVSQTERGIKIDRVFCAADVGRVVDPVNFENQVMGGIVWGLGHAMNCEITYTDGIADQTNYHAYEGMRLYQTPEMIVKGLENGDEIRGIGEPTVPPAAPALANAIFALTGQRIRELPLNKHVDFA
jgi:isoquinoline 1-oxidoreductase beta subunit